jgi:ABC-type nitrate/sulfonate/bicarbonate transport system substrate-binding protein
LCVGKSCDDAKPHAPVAVDLEVVTPPELMLTHERSAEIMMAIDGAHIRAAHGYQSRHIDVTVRKIEVEGGKPRRFALAPKGASTPLATLRNALREQGWRPGRTGTVLSDGGSALPGLVRAAVN